jgi:hypothetical protein
MTTMTAETSDLRIHHRARSAQMIREGLSVLSSKWAVGVLLALSTSSSRSPRRS